MVSELEGFRAFRVKGLGCTDDAVRLRATSVGFWNCPKEPSVNSVRVSIKATVVRPAVDKQDLGPEH